MEWKKVPISSICEGIYEGPHATPPSCESGAYYLGIPALTSDGQIDFSKVPRICEKDFKKWTKRVTPKYGDIVFTNEATLNLYARIPKDFYGCLGRRLGLVRPLQDKVDVDYLFYYFFSPYWRKVIALKKVSGSTVERILMKKFPHFPVLLPPLNIQNKIASILSAYDNLIENNNRRIRLLEQMAENLYKEWFVRFRFPGHEKAELENGLPKGWREEVASNVIDVMSGGTPKTEREDFYGGDIPFYTPKDADDSIFAYSTITNITEEGLAHCNSQYYPTNTLMITARGTVGKLSLLAVPMAMNQSCFALRFKDGKNPYYLYYSIKNEVAKLKKMANGGVFDTIIVKTFDHIKIIIPSDKLLGAFDSQVTPILGQIQHLQRQSTLLSRQRDLLLPRLMSGKLEVNI